MNPASTIRSFGWLEEEPGTLDPICGTNRDASHELLAAATALPAEASLVWALPAFKDQDGSNTCVAHGWMNGAETRLAAVGTPVPPGSRRQLYTYSNMLLKRSKTEKLRDDGTYARTAAHVAKVVGVANETDWPLYDPTTGVLNDVTKEVPPDILQRASSWKLDEQETIYATGDDRVRAVASALARREPIPCAGDWDSAMENYDGRGVLTAPDLRRRIGGHMVCVVAYRTNQITKKLEFLIRNSWRRWGLVLSGQPSLAWVDEEWIKAQREMYRLFVTAGRKTK